MPEIEYAMLLEEGAADRLAKLEEPVRQLLLAEMAAAAKRRELDAEAARQKVLAEARQASQRVTLEWVTKAVALIAAAAGASLFAFGKLGIEELKELLKLLGIAAGAAVLSRFFPVRG